MLFSRRITPVVGIVALSFLAAPAAFAAGECAKITNIKKRDICIENKIDALAATAATAASVQTAVNNALTGVKVEWAAHPGVCLYFSDWAAGKNYAQTVLDCSHTPEQTFNIHK